MTIKFTRNVSSLDSIRNFVVFIDAKPWSLLGTDESPECD